MRFLDTTTYVLVSDGDKAYQDSDGKYAILSHRWITRRKGDPPRQEIRFDTLRSERLMHFSRNSARRSEEGEHAESMNKIIDACAVARSQDLKWLWIDTCCINKANAVEEGRSINSMFDWYNRASACYAYLADVSWQEGRLNPFTSTDKERESSEWFERGWTLQELLAPAKMWFFDKHWTTMGSKTDLAPQISKVTGIQEQYLTCADPIPTIRSANIATRLSWMAGRITTEPEDIAYSLLGILDETITPQYGEGHRAFMRLQEQLIRVSKDETIFAWTLPDDGELKCFRGDGSKGPKFAKLQWGLLAPSPDCFKNSKDVVVLSNQVTPRIPPGYSMTQHGLQFATSLKSPSDIVNVLGRPRSQIDWALNCWKPKNGQLQRVVVHLVATSDNSGRDYPGKLYLRDRLDSIETSANAKITTNKSLKFDQLLTRPLNIHQPPFGQWG